MHQIDTDLLNRLRRAGRQASAVSRGLMQQLVDCERQRISAAGALASARIRLEAWPGGQPLVGEDDQSWSERRNQEEIFRADMQRAARVHFRDNPEGLARAAAELGRPSQADFYAAVEGATALVAKVDEEIASITQAQALAGARAGELALTVQRAEEWLLANGYAAEVAA